jgi:hypothetical protein
MAIRVELELYEAGKHERKIAELVPQEDGTERVEVRTEFGPLAIVLGAPVVQPPAAEPEPEPVAESELAPAPASKSGKASARR